MIESHSSFLLNFYDDLLGNIGLILSYFNSLLTSRWKDYLMFSGQSQKMMELSEFIVKNSLRSFNIAMK